MRYPSRVSYTIVCTFAQHSPLGPVLASTSSPDAPRSRSPGIDGRDELMCSFRMEHSAASSGSILSESAVAALSASYANRAPIHVSAGTGCLCRVCMALISSVPIWHIFYGPLQCTHIRKPHPLALIDVVRVTTKIPRCQAPPTARSGPSDSWNPLASIS